MNSPRLISFSTRGNKAEGHLHIVPQNELPFRMERIFYTMDTPEGISRGRHAHHQTEMVLLAVKGAIAVRTVTIGGEEQTFTLDQPAMGLYLPVLCWHEMNYSNDAVQLVICSTAYSESDYIRDWDHFLQIQQQYGKR